VERRRSVVSDDRSGDGVVRTLSPVCFLIILILTRSRYAAIYLCTTTAFVSNSYFTFYQALRHSLEDLRIVPDWSTPLFAGPVARTTTVLLSAPLELVRTRVQARAAGEAGSDTIRGVWRDVLRTDGAAGLFRGVLPTLWRDVPFSMAYWFMYERTLALYTLYGPRPHYVDEFENGVRAPAALRNLTSERDVIPSSVHFAAGALSGSIAAVMTVKSRSEI
jgi:hypothetical protein